MRREYGFSISGIAFLVWLLICLGSTVATAWVVIHFIIKWW